METKSPMPTSTLSPNTEKNNQLLIEVKKLTQQLEILNQPWKQAKKSFITGIFTALGSTFGTVIVIGVLAYIFSRLPFTKNLIELFKDPKNFFPKV